MKNIFITIDSSPHSEKAIDFSIAIAKQTNSSIIVSNKILPKAVDLHASTFEMDMPTTNLYAIEEKFLINTCRKIALNKSINGNPIRSSFITEENCTKLKIQTLLNQKEIDLFIVGFEKQSHISELF